MYQESTKRPTWPGLRVGGEGGQRDNRRRSPVFGRGGVGRRMAGVHRDSGKSSGTITALPLCLEVASQDIPQQGPGTGTAGLSILGFTPHLLVGRPSLLKPWHEISMAVVIRYMILEIHHPRKSYRHISEHISLSLACCTATLSSQAPVCGAPFTSLNHNTTNQAGEWQGGPAETHNEAKSQQYFI